MGVQSINFANVGTAKYNGAVLNKVIFNGSEIWTSKAPPGSQTFTSNGTFVVPTGVTSVNICVVGGGGGGYGSTGTTQRGGSAGATIKQTISVTPGENIPVVIGAGGGQNASGGSSTFGNITAAGGGGMNYNGNGATAVSACNGITYKDGSYVPVADKFSTTYFYGGQKSSFGNGGNGNGTGRGYSGGVGAGGGAGGTYGGGSGGRGQIVVSWS